MINEESSSDDSLNSIEQKKETHKYKGKKKIGPFKDKHILIDENTYEAELKLKKQVSPVETVIQSRVKYLEKKMP